MVDNATEKMIMLRSFDGGEFEVSVAEAMMIQTVRHMIEDNCADNTIPLPNVDAKTLSLVIEYCRKHVTETEKTEDGAAMPTASKVSDEELKKWDEHFIDVGQAMLYNILMAANYLSIKGLLELACQKVADMIKGKTPDEIRHAFNIKNDFTPEEEEEIRRENQWAFE